MRSSGLMDRLRKLNIGDYAAEAVFFLFKMGESLLEPSLGLYIYQCVCLDHDRMATDPGEACHNLSQYPEVERQVQKEAADYMIAHRVLLNFPAIIVGLFCGAWSDVIGRRVPVFLTLGASLVAVVMYLFSLLPSGPTGQRSALALVLVGAAVRGGVGKSAVITMALYSYVCDVAPRAQRTQKIGRLLSMNYFGFFVGSMTAGALLEFHGFYVIFAAVLVLQIACAVVAVRYLKTTEQIAAERLEVEDGRVTAVVCPSDAATSVEGGGGGGQGVSWAAVVTQSGDGESVNKHCGDGFGDEKGKQSNEKASFQAPPSSSSSSSSPLASRFPFHLSYVRDSVTVLVQQRPNHDRLHVIALFVTLFVIQTCRAGETQATLLFAERSPLSWKKSMYGYLLATEYAGLGLSTLVVLPFLIRLFHLADMSMVLIGVCFRIVRLVIMATSSTTLGIYVSVIVGAPSSLIVSCGKALISKTIHSSEIGKVFALISCAEPVSSLIGTVVFSTVYRLTFDRIYPGFVFALEVAFFVCLFCALVALWYDIRRCAASPYGALMEETQLRSAAFTAPIDGRLAVASSAAEAKAATRSSESLTEIMNAWPQQHDYGTAADSNSSSRLCQSGVPHQDATESDELRRDDVIDGRDVVDGDPGRHRSRNGYGVGRRQHFGPANDQSHDVTGIRGADVDSRQWS